MADQELSLEINGRIAVITINLPKKLNAMTQPLYYRLATYMNEVAANPKVYITVLTGKGRFFSA